MPSIGVAEIGSYHQLERWTWMLLVALMYSLLVFVPYVVCIDLPPHLPFATKLINILFFTLPILSFGGVEVVSLLLMNKLAHLRFKLAMVAAICVCLHEEGRVEVSGSD